jgi:DNA helicase IV
MGSMPWSLHLNPQLFVEPPVVNFGAFRFTVTDLETIRVVSLGPIGLFTIKDLRVVTTARHAQRLAREAEIVWEDHARALLEAAQCALKGWSEVLAMQDRLIHWRVRPLQNLKAELGDRVLRVLPEVIAATPRLSEYIEQHAPALDRQVLVACHQALGNPRGTVKTVNQRVLAADLERYGDLFDRIEKTPLTQEQRIAAIVHEPRNLLVAAAGSGKTSTLVAKIGYLLERGLATPDEILCLAYNKAAAEELQERLDQRLGLTENNGVRSGTFHAFGQSIITRVTGKKPIVFGDKKPGDRRRRGGNFGELIANLKNSDQAFFEAYLRFIAVHMPYVKPLEDFSDLEGYLRYGRTAEVRDQSRLKALNGTKMRSQEEVKIANWLFTHGINYQYEKPYKLDTSRTKQEQYLPDFYYPEIDTYHEHFALNAREEPPPFIDGPKYKGSVKWKRELHQSAKNSYFETSSALFSNGTVFRVLEAELRARGLDPQPLSAEVLDKKISVNIKTSFDELLQTFVRQVKSNRLRMIDLQHAARSERERDFLKLAAEVKRYYEAHLTAHQQIDFDDMLLQAADHLKAGHRTPYRVVLIDEFQDAAIARMHLVETVLAQHDDPALFAVGDDWQSIYRFAGAKLEVMREMQGHEDTSTNHLNRTFRCAQGISDVASQFVMRNAAQFPKTITSVNPKIEATCEVRYATEKTVQGDLETLLREEIAALEHDGVEDSPSKPAVFVLGRFTLDCPKCLVVEDENKNQTRKHRLDGCKLHVGFKTIHGSKGLEAEVVIINDVHVGGNRFPMPNMDDPLMQLVLPEDTSYPYAEERRLLYVALTRAKRKVLIVADVEEASPFVAELIAMNHPAIKVGERPEGMVGREAKDYGPCPICFVGRLKRKLNKRGEFFVGCSNYKPLEGGSGCSYTRDLTDTEQVDRRIVNENT